MLHSYRRRQGCADCLKVWGKEVERYLKEIDELRTRVRALEQRTTVVSIDDPYPDGSGAESITLEFPALGLVRVERHVTDGLTFYAAGTNARAMIP